MVTIVKKGISKKLLQERIRKIKPRRKLDAYKYRGILKLDRDPLEIQKELRSEWN